ncbi:MAG TPA: DUF4388 domain-containing protein [Gemmatimonadaceae bacterium]
MAIRGSLKEASLPDVLQLLSLGKKTGCLSVSHKGSFGSIYFNQGRISYASIVNRRDRLGDLLVKNGIISPEQLQRAIDAQHVHPNVRVGELLVAQGSLRREQLEDVVRVQIEEAVYFLFTWTEGTFNFEADVAPEAQDVTVSINPESLLLEGARRVDEWSLIEKKVPSFDVIFELDRPRLEASDVKPEGDQKRVLDLIDGRRDVTGLIEESGLGEFEVGKALFGLATAGFIQRVGKSRPSIPAVSQAKVEEHHNLGIAFYRTGMLDEAQREFRRVLDLRDNDPQARFFLGLILLRQQQWDEAVRVFREAAAAPGARPAVLHNLAFGLERLGRFEEARTVLEDALRRGGAKDARVHTSLGIVTLRLGDVAAADAAFQGARGLFGAKPPTPLWFHFAVLGAALQGDLPRAAALVAEGLAAHPRAAVLHNDDGVLRERRGDIDGATAALERGLAEDPTLPQLHKNLGDCLYRAGRYDEAFDAYQRAVKADPGLGDDVWLRLGNIHFRRMAREDAARCWERALELDPDNAIVRTNLESVRQLQ